MKTLSPSAGFRGFRNPGSVFFFFLFFTACVVMGNFYIARADGWTQKAGFGGGERYYATGFRRGHYEFMGLGRNSAGTVYYADFWKYDEANNTWTQIANFPGAPRVNAVGMNVAGYGYVGTGWDGHNFLKDFWQYDKPNNTWTRKADFGGTARYFAYGFCVGNNDPIGYVVGGNDGSNKSDLWQYNATNDAWVQKASYPGNGAGWGCAGFGLIVNSEYREYVGTGSNGATQFKDFYEYNSATDTWTQKADFPGTAHTNAVSFILFEKGYIGLGEGPSGTLNNDH